MWNRFSGDLEQSRQNQPNDDAPTVRFLRSRPQHRHGQSRTDNHRVYTEKIQQLGGNVGRMGGIYHAKTGFRNERSAQNRTQLVGTVGQSRPDESLPVEVESSTAISDSIRLFIGAGHARVSVASAVSDHHLSDSQLESDLQSVANSRPVFHQQFAIAAAAMITDYHSLSLSLTTESNSIAFYTILFGK